EDALDRQAAHVLRKTASDGEPLARRLALISIARAGAREGRSNGGADGLAAARQFLCEVLAQRGAPIRPWAALALGVLEQERIRQGGQPSDESAHALRVALETHDSPAEAGAYCLALALAHDTTSAKLLVTRALEKRDDDLQADAALSLGILGDRSAI